MNVYRKQNRFRSLESKGLYNIILETFNTSHVNAKVLPKQLTEDDQASFGNAKLTKERLLQNPYLRSEKNVES